MAKRPDIKVDFDGDASGLRKTMTQIEKNARGFGQRLRSAFSTIGAVSGFRGAGAAAGALSGAAVADQLGQLINDLDELGKTATGLNTTVESLSQLQFAVSQTSTITEQQLNTVLQRLNKHIGQAIRGVKTSQGLFRELGLDWEYLSGLQADQAFLEVAGAIAAIEDPFARASLAQKLFEDNWRALLPTLEAGEDQLRNLINRAAELGGPTTEAAEAAAKFNDSIGQLNRSISNLAIQGIGPAIEVFNDFLDLTGLAARPGGEIDRINQKIDELNGKLEFLSGDSGTGIISWLGSLLGSTEGGEKAIEQLNKQLDALIERREKLEQQRAPSAAGITAEELEQRRAEPEAKKAMENERKEAEIKKEKVKAEEQELGNLTEREERLRALDESVNKTTEALLQFQQGLITQAELAEAMGLDVSPALKQVGASGTASNLSGPRTATGGPLRPIVDAEGVAQELEYAITQRTYRINIEANVTPSLAESLQTQESVETLADQVGGI